MSESRLSSSSVSVTTTHTLTSIERITDTTIKSTSSSSADYNSNTALKVTDLPAEG